ncbi:class I SAM-dependent methyltransferase [Brachyspira pilosicoli]|uniref:O-methyltransferase protein-like protein n=1 Tax=Brachyspira pilosicoli (strain ATCC BAA-1826 / 95/1000) TaxID=759914 RepID=D8IF01_BRAP9|nr:class I SAM-dependent methyltransferase [Brachyspira pilosicoli]ADK31724.1 O-methyltransferase protein-like protein [Brachyspira pilosicoli 95/1000]
MYNHNLFYNEQYEIKGQKYDEQINEWSQKYKSLMSMEQKRFLMSIISENKMKNVLEIGIFNGVSSLCMLKAGLSVNKDFNLYAIDLNDNEDFVGQAVFGFCNEEELKHYHINRGKTTFDIENIIPKDIKFDLVFIDAGHHHPHPLFDLILSRPYMYENTIIVLHDVINYYKPYDWGGSFIFESWKADKYKIYKDYNINSLSNMGCIKLYKTDEELCDNIKIIANNSFRAFPWGQLEYYKDIDIMNSLTFNLDDIKKLKTIMEKHYPKEFSNEIYNILVSNYEEYKKNCLLYIHEMRFFNYLYNSINNLNNKLNKLINMIVWWIPIKKIRDNIRKKLNE